MFTLLKVELHNIRSHEHISFEPSKEGITAIVGENGAGKSTIIDTIPWVLFGTKPNGVSKVIALLKDGKDVVKDGCYAKVWLKLENSILKVERKIVNKQGAVHCSVYEKIDGEEEYILRAGEAVSHSQPYIKKRIGLDEDGFLTAIFVQQKQVDNLVSARASERRSVIEKLLGISGITAALDEARQSRNLSRKTLKNTVFDPKIIKALEKDWEDNKKEIETLTKKRNELDTEYENKRKLGEEYKSRIENVEKFEKKVNELKSIINEKNTELSILEPQFSEMLKIRKEKKKRITDLARSFDYDDTEHKLISMKAEYNETNGLMLSCVEKIKKYDSTIQEYKKIVAVSTVKDIETASKKYQEMKAKRDKAAMNLAKLQKMKIYQESHGESFVDAIEVISTSKNGKCPTCLQQVEDTKTAIASLENDRKLCEEKIVELSNNIEKHEKSIANLDVGLEKYEILIDALTQSENLEQEKNDTIKKKNDLEKIVIDLESDVKNLEKVFADLKRNAEYKAEYDEVQKKTLDLSNKIENSKEEKIAAKQELAELDHDEEPIEILREKREKLSQEVSDIFAKLADYNKNIAVLNEKTKLIDERIQKNREESEKYENLRNSVIVEENSLKIIEEFREERIRNSIPIVNSYASDLLSRFTDGAFSQLVLKENFEVEVVPTGNQPRTVGLLSGGELSAAAISLRVAISMLLNDGAARNALVLDEVLVSQDYYRSEKILMTIKEVCQGQVIMISHSQNTNEIADKIVEL